MKRLPRNFVFGAIIASAMGGLASEVQAVATCSLAGGKDSTCTILNDSLGGMVYYQNPSNLTNVGSGLIDPFLTVQKDTSESGFSTDAASPDLPLDDKRAGGNAFTRTFSLSQLGTVSGTGIGNGTTLYYEFALDINEPDSQHGDPDSLLTLDYLNIYDTGSSSPVLLGSPTSLNDLNLQGWSLRYSLDTALFDNSLLLDYDLFGKGSGQQFDMVLLVPISVFSGVSSDSRIVFANTFGSSGTKNGSDSADGFEEWAYLKGTGAPTCPIGSIGTPPNCEPVPDTGTPEPGTLALLAIGILGLGLSTVKRRPIV